MEVQKIAKEKARENMQRTRRAMRFVVFVLHAEVALVKELFGFPNMTKLWLLYRLRI